MNFQQNKIIPKTLSNVHYLNQSEKKKLFHYLISSKITSWARLSCIHFHESDTHRTKAIEYNGSEVMCATQQSKHEWIRLIYQITHGVRHEIDFYSKVKNVQTCFEKHFVVCVFNFHCKFCMPNNKTIFITRNDFQWASTTKDCLKIGVRLTDMGILGFIKIYDKTSNRI